MVRSGALESAIWPKRSLHGLKRALCARFKEISLFSRFGDDLRPVGRY